MAHFVKDTNEGNEGYEAKVNDSCSCIKQFLSPINMMKYYDMLLDNGCETIQIIATLSKNDLKEMGMKIGHANLFYATLNDGKTLKQFAVCRCNQKLVVCGCCNGKGIVQELVEKQLKKSCMACHGKGNMLRRGECPHPRNGGEHHRYKGSGNKMAYSSFTQCPDCDMQGFAMILKRCNVCAGNGYTRSTQKKMVNVQCKKCNGNRKIYVDKY